MPTVPPNTSGFCATSHDTSAIARLPFENSNRDGRCCSTGIPENVNFAASSDDRAVDGGQRQLRAPCAAPFAEKLPTMPPVATLPVMRSIVSCSPFNAALMLSCWTASGRADPAERAVLDRERADGAEAAAVAAQIELHRRRRRRTTPARRTPCRGEWRPGSRRRTARGSCRRAACSIRPTRSTVPSRRARTDPSTSRRRRACVALSGDSSDTGTPPMPASSSVMLTKATRSRLSARRPEAVTVPLAKPRISVSIAPMNGDSRASSKRSSCAVAR